MLDIPSGKLLFRKWKRLLACTVTTLKPDIYQIRTSRIGIMPIGALSMAFTNYIRGVDMFIESGRPHYGVGKKLKIAVGEEIKEINLSEENYFAVLRGKTGSLISAACEVGAFFAEGSSEHQAALRTYGEALGLAFQVVDDLLDYLGDPQKTGKAVGNDFVEGKLTLPLLHALQNCPEKEHDFIMDLLKGEAATREGEVGAVRDFIERNGGFSYARIGVSPAD